jgi:glycosyltransferase involved in cell wall biosynthesis
MNIDLHVHSKYSTRPSQWVLQKLGCHECYTEPLALYRLAKERGMSLVTITDHNTINGCLDIAHLPDTFISEEVTTYFPDGCKIHVVVYDITEEQHRDLQKVRDDIFDLAAYLQSAGIVHSVAHPLWAVNNLLTVEHFEQLLLLFKNFELNGSRDEQLNIWLQAVCLELTPALIDQLAEKHGCTPKVPYPWVKNFTGGSDDHSSRGIAQLHTRVEGANDLADFLQKVQQGAATVQGRASTPLTLGYNIYSIAYQFYKEKYQLNSQAGGHTLTEFLEKILHAEAATQQNFPKIPFYFYRLKQALKPEQKDPGFIESIQKELLGIFAQANCPPGEREWFEVLDQLSRKLLKGLHTKLRRALADVNFLDLFNVATSSGLVYLGIMPYTAAFSSFAADRHLGRAMAAQFLPESHPQRPASLPLRIAHFTDTFYEVNGVALSIRNQAESARLAHKDYTVITCDTKKHSPQPGVQTFTALGVFNLPEYPEQKLFHPPFLEVLHYCYHREFTHLLAATPGPLGLTAMALARALGLPLWGTYHTALPQYARYLTGDQAIVDLMWKYVVWFYNQMDLIFIPSLSTAQELEKRGVNRQKMRVFPRGVDLRLFHPAKRNGFLENRFQVQGGVKLLYVGRVSREKNMEVLARVFKGLVRDYPQLHLVVVGDGPYLEEMQRELAGSPCTFTGYLHGEDLAAAYASCDLFLFPSTTDTFGNVVLEAQASGLPVIVTDSGGPQENVRDGETGLIVPSGHEEGWQRAVQDLLAQPERLGAMGRAARRSMEQRSFEAAFQATWKLFEEHARG